MNKSLATNLIAAALVVVGMMATTAEDQILFTGMFALSGAITNWIAVYMLFEKVPFLYGSGVIPTRFEEFKSAIHTLMMGQFFTKENVERLITGGPEGATINLDVDAVQSAIDYDQVFDNIADAVLESKLGSMLGMFGGKSALSSMKEPVERTLKKVVADVIQTEDFQIAIAGSLGGSGFSDTIITKVDGIVLARLDELTPNEVKRIIQEMIREHLGWLVVWGGVFGGLIGLVTSFLQ